MKKFVTAIVFIASAFAASAQTQTWGNISIGGRDGHISGGFHSHERQAPGYGAGYYQQRPPVLIAPPIRQPYYGNHTPEYVYRLQGQRFREQRYCLEDYRNRCYMDRRYGGSTYACDVPPIAVRQACMR